MKRTISIVLVLMLIIAVFSGCKPQQPVSSGTDIPVVPTVPATSGDVVPDVTPEIPAEEPVTIRLGGLKGPTTMGMVKFLDDVEKGTSGWIAVFLLLQILMKCRPNLLRVSLI